MAARSPIRCLFFARRPADIAGFVALVVLDAVKAIGAAFAVSTRWPLAYIGGKILELQPTLAHCDATSAIVFKALVFRVAAAVQHRAPDVVKLGSTLKMFAVIARHIDHFNVAVWKFKVVR